MPKPSGLDILAQAMTDQVCGWFDIPPQRAPEIVVLNDEGEFKAKFFPADYVIHIYGSFHVQDGILAHEIAHAVISRYGKITPRMHEILAGYAEFKITKVFKHPLGG